MFTPDATTRATESLERANRLQEAGRCAEALEAYEALHRAAPSALSAYGCGLALASLDRKTEALELYREAVRRDPRFPEARLNLANLLRERGQAAEALHHHLFSLALRPHEPLCLVNVGIDWSRLAEPALAREMFGRVLARQPQSLLARSELDRLAPVVATASELDAIARAQHDRALQAAAGGHASTAMAIFEDVLARNPRAASTWIEYGNSCLAAGQAQAAVAAQRRALALQPTAFAAWHNLGAAGLRMDPQSAIRPLQAAASLNPSFSLTWRLLASAHRAIGDLAAAWDCHAVCCSVPDAPTDALVDLADVSRALRRPEEAIDAMRRVIAREPHAAMAHNNLGAYLLDLQRLDEAGEAFEKAAELDPKLAVARSNIAAVRELRGDFSGALAGYREALRLQPDDAPLLVRVMHMAQHQCDWEGIEELFMRVRSLASEDRLSGVSPFSLLAIPGVDAQAQLQCSRRFARDNYGPLERLAFGPPPLPAVGDKIRIGYLSSDLHDHATAWLIAEVIELHDRNRFEVFGYSYGANRTGSTRLRLEGAFDLFRDVEMLKDEEIAVRIRQDGIHILVDLKGYTQGTRTGILALRPAPIQINYLGFPGTLGADFIDYIVADPVIIPPRLENAYSERVLRLPHCYQPNDRQRPRPAAPSRREAGLPETGFVFAAFNNIFKITPDVFDAWCRILARVADSVLWILSSNEIANRNLRREAARRGIDPDRLIFAPRKALVDHLARFACADLMLDTFPCTAHTTASDALWAGVPVVTLMGDTFASRVAGSILHAIGLDELVAYGIEGYESIAIELAENPSNLSNIRARTLAGRETSPLFDTLTYTRTFEDALAGAVAAERAVRAS